MEAKNFQMDGDAVSREIKVRAVCIFLVLMGEGIIWSDEYSGQFYTVIPEVGNRRSDVKETVIPEPWKPWFLPL